MKLIDFSTAPIVWGAFYGGDAGAKDAIQYNGAVWILKYPKTTRDMINPQISYTTSPLSEYLGSQIYAILGIPVHETVLGTKKSKLVVICKDFTFTHTLPDKWLIPFHNLKNNFMASDLDSYSGSGSETLLDEVLDTVNGQVDLQKIPGVLERFWDMFVIDAFIGNNDRNNGNWGLLHDMNRKSLSLAPVFDNGNAFFNKKGIANMEKRLADPIAMTEDAYKTFLCVYKYKAINEEGRKINPFTFIKQGDDPNCTAAVARFLTCVDMTKIEAMINTVPETFGPLSVMPRVQKDYYLALMRLRLEFLSQV